MLIRRRFSQLMAGVGPLASSESRGGTPLAPVPGEGHIENCDLLIKGGTVIDAGQGLHAKLDVVVNDGKILKLAPGIPAVQARRVVSAQGKLVTPGLMDVHVHIFEGVGVGGINADQYCLSRGVTTAVDAGSAGYPAIAGLRKYVINKASTRLFALVDIGGLGLVVKSANSMKNMDWVNPQLTARAAEENKPAVVGIKVRLSKDIIGDMDLEGLKRALAAAEASNLPLVVHIGDTHSRLPQILQMMRKGDVVTHVYNNQPHGVLDGAGKILPEVPDARARGVFFDTGHGFKSMDFDIVERCLQQNFLPDTISTDLADSVVNGPVFDLVTTLSKFLSLGLSLDQVIERATGAAARMFDYGVELGTLRPGAVADLSILELRDGEFSFVDSGGKKRTGRQKIESVAATRAGELHVNRSDG